MCSRGKECSLERSNSREEWALVSESYSVVRVEAFPEEVPWLGDRMEEKVGKDAGRGPSAGVPRRAREVVHSHKS